MNEAMDYLKTFGAPAVLLVALYVIGMALKRTPGVPNWLIPWALPIVGALVYPFIGAAFPLPFKVQNGVSEAVIYALCGFGLGGICTWGNQLIRQTLAAWKGDGTGGGLMEPTAPPQKEQGPQ